MLCGADLVELFRRYVPSALNCKQLGNCIALLYISARTRGTFWLVYEATSEVRDFRGLKSQGHFQEVIIRNCDWTGEVFQLQYSYVTLIKFACISRYSAHHWHLPSVGDQFPSPCIIPEHHKLSA